MTLGKGRISAALLALALAGQCGVAIAEQSSSQGTDQGGGADSAFTMPRGKARSIDFTTTGATDESVDTAPDGEWLLKALAEWRCAPSRRPGATGTGRIRRCASCRWTAANRCICLAITRRTIRRRPRSRYSRGASAIPKSITITRPSWRMMLSGLTSPWITPWRWEQSSASATSRAMRTAFSAPNGVSR